ncbi:MAG: ROK family protein [Clostridia bacterium]|nr:ROK family protein [Clostridia bacterium]MBR2915596.1 ROK family protein [Clostridia bacterium]
MSYFLGIDIGGTKVKLGVVDSEKRITVYDTSVRTRVTAGETAIVEDIIAAAKKIMEEYPIERVGIGSAGRIDRENGIVITAGNLPFRNLPLAKLVSDALGVPAMLDNDGNCAVIGEYLAGVARGKKDVVMITVGTGIGGGVICNGKLLVGKNGRAGELGHTVINIYDPTPCACGLHGCFEQYCSTKALTADTAEAVVMNPLSITAAVAEERDGVDGQTAFIAAERGCPVAQHLLDKYFENFSLALNSLVKIFMPEIVIIAGGITNEGEGFLSRLRPHLLPEAEVVISPLKGDCGLFGAALQWLL